MTRVLAYADRSTGLALALIGLANVLFFLSFLAVALFAGQTARAASAACAGKDMLAELAAGDPARLQAIRAEAAKVVNGQGLLWKVEKPGQPQPSYVFGTMHMTDPRVVELTPAAQDAFEASETVVIETTDILDQSAMMAAILKQPDLMMFTDATTLPSLMSPRDADAAKQALQARGIPFASVVKMKPWMLSAMVALPACEHARKAAGAPVLDLKLAEDARAAGKELGGLETAVSQLEAMASLPMELHIKGLVETLKLGSRMDDVVETMIVIYETGETGLFWPFFDAALPSQGTSSSGFAEFEQTMITARNRTMAAKAERFLAKGGAFIAVGALHLPGREGLVELLRSAGYTVSRAG